MPTGSLQFGITGFPAADPELYFAFVTASAQRQGLYITAPSGSPQISLEPRSGSPDFLLPGDIWYTLSGSSGDGNLFLAEADLADGVVIAKRFVTARQGETIVQAISRFTSSDAPSDLIVAAEAFVTDNWFTTANSPSVSGALIRNLTWDAGLIMTDQDTIAVSGSDINFLVPSGSFTITKGDALIQSGSLTVRTGSLFLTGDTSRLVISGSSVTASLLGNPIISVLTGSANSASLSPIPLEGTLYINTSTEEIALRASGTYFDLDFSTPDVVDGGSY